MVAPSHTQILGWGIRTRLKSFLKQHGILPCGYIKNMSGVLDDPEKGLWARVFAQDWAVQSIVQAFEAHDLPSGTKADELTPPMFMFFAGSTGVGKTCVEVLLRIVDHQKN